MSDYYILSMKYPPVGNCALFWGPDNGGYTCNLNEAGLYTEEQVRGNEDYYNNGRDTIAVPRLEVENQVIAHVRYGALIKWQEKAREIARRREREWKRARKAKKSA